MLSRLRCWALLLSWQKHNWAGGRGEGGMKGGREGLLHTGDDELIWKDAVRKAQGPRRGR
eukprot:833123-Rhodomonas_salina.2